MNAPQHFNHHSELQACLGTTAPNVLVPILIDQLTHEFDPALLDWPLIHSLDPRLMQQQRLLPLLFWENTLYLASPDPLPLSTLSDQFQCPLQAYTISDTTFQQFCQALTQLSEHANSLEPSPETDIPISTVFEDLLTNAQQLRASDIHIEPQMDHSVLVRYRIDGLLHDIKQLSSEIFPYSTRLVSKIKVAADLDIAETRVPQDGRITALIQQESVDLRVSTLPSLHGEKVVIRLLPHKNRFQELRHLGLEGNALLTYYNWVKKPQGMVLITGQTGSGKTSTLYTTLSHMLQAEKNIVTIEDPIEYQLKGITQVQVHPKVGLTFANGLRSILRQDPDTILLGEIRDTETAEIAYQAALTGHLVLSTLHTNDAPSAIIRLMDIHVEPYLIASATLGVVAQRLIRRVCVNCAEAYTPGRDLLNTLNLLDSLDSQPLFYRAVGCEYCFNTGYYGREGIFEVMPIDEELAALITQKEQLSRIRAYLQSKKIQSLFESAVRKVERGITTVDEIYRVVPPSQHTRRLSTPGSVFVWVLFLLTILSILVINMADVFEGQINLLKLQKNSLEGTYATQAALQLGYFVLAEKFSQGRLYFAPLNAAHKPEPSLDILAQIPELAELTHPSSTITLGTTNLDSRYQLSWHPVPTRPDSTLMDYTYTILSKTTLKNQQTNAPQQLSGTFQVETGPLPLSFFERYTTTGPLPVSWSQQSQGPWYSPQRDTDTRVPTLGYYDAQTQPLAISDSLWPELGDPQAESQIAPIPPAVYLTPIPTGVGASLAFPPPPTPPSSAFDTQTTEWAFTLYGTVDRMMLQAPSPSTQLIEFDQSFPASLTKTANGYQTLRLLKTICIEDLYAHRVELTSQTWQLTMNPQRDVVQQKLINTSNQTLADHFSGLIRVQGTVNAVMSGNTNGQSSYNRPLTLVASTDIGLPVSLLRQPGARQASFGVISQNGTIAFQPLQPVWLRAWDPEKERQLTFQAALASTRYRTSDENSILVQGSVASLNSPFPDGLQTQSDPVLYSLRIHPPFYPQLNPGTQACLITRPPHDTHWEEARSR